MGQLIPSDSTHPIFRLAKCVPCPRFIRHFVKDFANAHDESYISYVEIIINYAEKSLRQEAMRNFLSYPANATFPFYAAAFIQKVHSLD